MSRGRRKSTLRFWQKDSRDFGPGLKYKTGSAQNAGRTSSPGSARTSRSPKGRHVRTVLAALAALTLLLGFFAARRLLTGMPISPALSGAAQAARSADPVMAAASGDLTVSYIDVGEGMATLIACQDHYMVIDGGGREASSKFVAFLKKAGVDKLDYLVASHYDEDHLAGLIGAVNTFPTDRVIAPDYDAGTAIFDSFKRACASRNIPTEAPSPGAVYSLGTAAFQVLGPADYAAELENDRSLVILLTNGTCRFLFSGDAEAEEEQALLASGLPLEADVLSAPHHGSSTSSSDAFLDEVDPSIVVISAGAENEYHHPHPSVLSRYKARRIRILRTDQNGTITITATQSGLTVLEERP